MIRETIVICSSIIVIIIFALTIAYINNTNNQLIHLITLKNTIY